VKIVVTGGAGFIGANLCAHLTTCADVSEVVAFDDLSTGARDNLAGVDARLVEGSVLDADAVAAVLDGAGAVVHLAARPSVPRSIADPMKTHRVNVDGTMYVLESVRADAQVPYVLFASSSSVYGANAELPKREAMATLPRSPYAASKLAGESYVLAYQDSFGVPALPFRFFNVYGPLQQPGHAYAAVVPSFLHHVLRGEPVEVHGDGTQTRDFTHVTTVVRIIAEAIAGRVTATTPVNLAFGGRSSLLELLGMIEELVEHPVARVHVAPRAGDVRDSQADSTTLRALFPDVEPVGLREGLASTLRWMRTVA
jgi:UDP-glucose 4-epimerase